MTTRAGTLAGVLASIAITLFGLVLVTFFIGRMVPIDPALAIAGDHASPSVVAAIRQEFGFDHSVLVQLWMYLGKLVHGDLGKSVMTSRPVAEDVARFFPATFELATTAIAMALALGIPLGVVSATRQDSLIDHAGRVLCIVGQSVPVFVLGLVGLLIFYSQLGIAPGTGRAGVLYDGMVSLRTGLLTVDAAMAGQWGAFCDALAHLALPASLLAFFSLTFVARMTRAFMLDALSSEFVLTAQAKGLSARRVIWVHAFGNIGVRLLTVLALAYANLLEGTIVTETLFSWPGIGNYLTVSLLNADMNAVLGTTLLIGVIYLGLNLSADTAARLVDPRVRW